MKLPCTDTECWCYESDGPDTCEEPPITIISPVGDCVTWNYRNQTWLDTPELSEIARRP